MAEFLDVLPAFGPGEDGADAQELDIEEPVGSVDTGGAGLGVRRSVEESSKVRSSVFGWGDAHSIIAQYIQEVSKIDRRIYGCVPLLIHRAAATPDRGEYPYSL